MRHFRCSPLAIAALACGMGEAAPARPLVTPAGFALGMTAGGLRAPRTAVDIAPVAVPADHYLAATTGTVEQTRTALHRLLPPMRAGLEPNPERYSRVGRAAHGLGARYRQDCGGRDRCRACLNGPLALTDSAQPVTPLRPAASHYTPGLCPFRRQVFTTLVGDSPRYSPTKRGLAEPSTPKRSELSSRTPPPDQ